MRISIAPFTLARKPVSNWFMFKLAHYVVYRKQFPKLISDVYIAASLRLKHRIAELPLRVGIIRAL